MWRRAIGKLGRTVRLIPPAYVKPFMKWRNNDAADAEAIYEAAQRPTMRFVAVKCEKQQASAVVFRIRDLLMRKRTKRSTPCAIVSPSTVWWLPTVRRRRGHRPENPDSGLLSPVQLVLGISVKASSCVASVS
jgi:hypothetical protein